jgi:hypothetical protein
MEPYQKVWFVVRPRSLCASDATNATREFCIVIVVAVYFVSKIKSFKANNVSNMN